MLASTVCLAGGSAARPVSCFRYCQYKQGCPDYLVESTQGDVEDTGLDKAARSEAEYPWENRLNALHRTWWENDTLSGYRAHATIVLSNYTYAAALGFLVGARCDAVLLLCSDADDPSLLSCGNAAC